MSLKNKIEKIVQAIKNTDINQIEITSFWGFQKIKLSKDAIDNIKNKSFDKKTTNEDQNVILDSKIEMNEPVDDENINKEIKEVVDIKEYTVIKAPLVGTFYASAKPGDISFVDIGSAVTKGNALCIIEAMKIFNTIESEYNGEIMDIFVKDGEPVEFGQSLFSIKEN